MLARAEISCEFMKTKSLCRQCLQNQWTLVANFFLFHYKLLSKNSKNDFIKFLTLLWGPPTIGWTRPNLKTFSLATIARINKFCPKMMCFLSKSIWPYGPLTPLNLIPLHQNVIYKLVNTSLKYKMTFIGNQCKIIFGQNSAIQAIVSYVRKGWVKRTQDILRFKRILRKDTADQLYYEMLPAHFGHFDIILSKNMRPFLTQLFQKL